jgi:hypothetical protein
VTAAEPPPVERVQRQYVCGYCGALAGDQCVTDSGTPLASSHVARFLKALADGALALAPATADEVARGRIVP